MGGDQVGRLSTLLTYHLKPNRQIGMIKRVLYSAPRKAREVVYLALCQPIMEYVLFIPNLKGTQSVTGASEDLRLDILGEEKC